MAGFELTRRARADVVDIGVFTAERWNDDQAERYLAELYASFQGLADTPALGRACDHISPGLVRTEHGSHTVFSRMRAGGDLLICRILHKRMLPEAHVMDDLDAD